MPLIVTPRQFSQRSDYYHHLAQLTSAGIGVVPAIDMLVKAPPSPSYQVPLKQIANYLHAGESFASSLALVGQWTPAFDIALIQAGEYSGRLDVVFNLLSTYYAERAQLLRQALNNLAYPVFLLHMVIVLFPFLTFFSDGNLFLFLLKTLGLLIPIYGIIFGAIYAAQARRNEAWRAQLENLMHRIPLVGGTRHSLALARLAAALEALLNAGVTVVEAWDMAAAASGSPALQRAVANWKPKVLNGLTPAEAVSTCPYFPAFFANLYNTGEVSGQLDESLRRLHKHYLDEGTRRLTALSQWLPRIFYGGVALLIAYKVISFFSGYVDQIKNAGSF